MAHRVSTQHGPSLPVATRHNHPGAEPTPTGTARSVSFAKRPRRVRTRESPYTRKSVTKMQRKALVRLCYAALEEWSKKRPL